LDQNQESGLQSKGRDGRPVQASGLISLGRPIIYPLCRSSVHEIGEHGHRKVKFEQAPS
jgi:hypothetical protein